MVFSSTVPDTVALLSARLREDGATAGGWGYFRGKRSRIEPTCWALLALDASRTGDHDWAAFVAPHVAYLHATQTAAGVLSDTDGSTTNLAFDGLAATVLAAISPPAVSASVVSSLIQGIVRIKGIKADEADPRQDNSLQAWPWIPETFSWVEPTAWCMLALKRQGAGSAAVRARLDEAERMLANRCCDDGGWNYGNASVIGQDLRPHIPTTALALMALQDRRDREYVRRSLSFLEQHRFKEISSIALGLTAVALWIHERDSADIRDRLREIADESVDRGDVHAMSVALFALTLNQHDARALRVA